MLRLAGDGPARPELEALAGELGVADGVELLGGSSLTACPTSSAGRASSSCHPGGWKPSGWLRSRRPRWAARWLPRTSAACPRWWRTGSRARSCRSRTPTHWPVPCWPPGRPGRGGSAGRRRPGSGPDHVRLRALRGRAPRPLRRAAGGVSRALTNAVRLALPPPSSTVALQAALWPGDDGRRAFDRWVAQVGDPRELPPDRRQPVRELGPQLEVARRRHGAPAPGALGVLLRAAADHERRRWEPFRDAAVDLLGDEPEPLVSGGLATAFAAHPTRAAPLPRPRPARTGRGDGHPPVRPPHRGPQGSAAGGLGCGGRPRRRPVPIRGRRSVGSSRPAHRGRRPPGHGPGPQHRRRPRPTRCAGRRTPGCWRAWRPTRTGRS